MAEKKYFVNDGKSNCGPFEMSVVIDKVNKAELKATDHICVDADKDEWILICQHPEFLKHYTAQKPTAPTIGKRLPKGPASYQMSMEAEPNDAVVWDENTSEAPLQLETYQSKSHNVVKMAPAGAAPAAAGEFAHSVHTASAHTQTAIQTPVPTANAAAYHETSGDLTHAEWYVLKGRNRFGPFTYTDLIRMLQDKSVFEYDYVWCQGLDTWKRVAQIGCFSTGNIRALFATEGAGDGKLFVRRNYKRVKYETTVIAHDNKNVWKGKTLEVSEGGAGIVIQNAMILPGQNVYVHFSPGQIAKPFNVLCEVVSKRYMGGLRDSGSPVIYGIKFINITKQDREALREIQPAA